MLAQITRISPLTHISRTRILPHAGKVLARLDQQINALDAVAETRREGSHVLVDVQRTLNLKKTSRVEDIIVRKAGDHVHKGDILAEMKGLFPRVLRSPVTGKVAAVQGGRVFIHIQNPPRQLLSGFSGVVTGIIPDRGAVIENNGAVIQAVWGNGQINHGSLVSLLKNPKAEMGSLPLDNRLKGKVVVAGQCSSALTLRLAGRLGLHGLILPSMSPSLVPVAEQLPFPVVLVEGFGKIPYTQSAFEIFCMYAGREVCLFGASNTLGMGERPEVFIPLDESAQVKTITDKARTNPRVRVRISPYTGRTGTITSIYAEPVRLPSGLMAAAADVLLETNEKVIIPLVNLDMLE